MRASQFEILLDELAFPESPRWHDGRLLFSEKRAGRVVALLADGTVDSLMQIDGEPGGIGWAADGLCSSSRWGTVRWSA